MSAKNKENTERLLMSEPVAAMGRMLETRGDELPAYWMIAIRQMMVSLEQMLADQDGALKSAQALCASQLAMREQLRGLRENFLLPLLHQCEGDDVVHRVSVDDLKVEIETIETMVG